MHVTSVGSAKEILRSGQIEMRPCRVFGKKELTYFFVLRPAYRLKHDAEKQENITMFPFVFVVSPDNLGAPFHVYPMDTGGAAAGQFDAKADEYVPLEDYELSPSLDHAASHIAWLFGSKEAYYAGETKPDIVKSLAQFESEARSCVAIAELASTGHNAPDDRASAVEVAYARHVALKDHVKCAILPKQFLEDGSAKNSEFMNLLNSAGIEVRAYDWQPNVTPDYYRAEIKRIAREYLSDNGMLKP